MLDAPVSGGEPGAVAGTLAVMVGGKQAIFDKNLDLMQVMGGNIVLTGDIGAGHIGSGHIGSGHVGARHIERGTHRCSPARQPLRVYG